MIISISTLKGGVGKSTITQNLAVCLAESGYDVCIVDADTNQSAMQWCEIRERERLADDSIAEIPVFGQTDGAELIKTVKQLNEKFNIILIDGTPSLDKLTSKIILLADLLIIPIVPSVLDVWASVKFLDRYEESQAQKGRKIPAYLLVNQNQNTNLAKEVKEALDSIEIPVLKNSLKNRTAYREAVVKGRGVYEWKDVKAKAEMVTLSNEITKILKKL
ncbi:AAA family ATPase [Dyadobacter flavalbus]|uniref:AAA family ATPase n=1 Tax=Dyadobacter flavalbus TaxID=2579942 RepID=A0A5M8QVW4_9BACT|nr:AAA family ATPase [Dyadobacter flavalbus]KAA6438944.1 AAA family ATPase [Dyadobacter flavalbus]